MNHGYGDIEVMKVRNIDLAKAIFKWGYNAFSPNRYFKDKELFGDKTYETLNDMADDISKVINPNEEINIINNHNLLTKISCQSAMQYAPLNKEEMLELTKKILFLRTGKELEDVVR